MIHSDNYFQELPLRYDGAWIAAYWQRRPLRLLQRCLVCQAVCRFFFQLGSMITRHNQCVWSICFGSPRLRGSLHPSWFFQCGNGNWQTTRSRGSETTYETHTHTMHKEWEEQLCSYMAPLRMPSFHSMGMNVHLVFIYIYNMIYKYYKYFCWEMHLCSMQTSYIGGDVCAACPWSERTHHRFGSGLREDRPGRKWPKGWSGC